MVVLVVVHCNNIYYCKVLLAQELYSIITEMRRFLQPGKGHGNSITIKSVRCDENTE